VPNKYPTGDGDVQREVSDNGSYRDGSKEDNHADREPQRVQEMLVRFNEYAWEMAPSLYLEDLHKPRKYPTPIYRGDNPARP
jgi:hypothetical protein